MQEVLDFISHFKGAENTFLHGCCYWFAWILQERFDGRGYVVSIFHEPVAGHFIAGFLEDTEYINADLKIKFFDVRGDVTDLYNEDDLESVFVLGQTDERRLGRLMCDCKYFISPEDKRYPHSLRV